ncbi:glycosyltransferase, partial [Bacteroidota bacterium]
YSEDNTWSILKSYQEKYPAIIKIYRNEKNLGVYGNYQGSFDKVSGDIIFSLAGDDTFCEKIFEKTNELVFKNNIDFKHDDFIVLFDFMIKDKEGAEKVYSNSLIEKFDGISLKIRNLILSRSMGESSSVFKKRFFVEGNEKEVSYMQESIIDLQPYIFAKKYYYKPYVGSIYYSQIGISTKLNEQHRLHTQVEYYNSVSNIIGNLNNADLNWLKYEKQRTIYYMQPKLYNLLKYFLRLLSITNIKYGLTFMKREYKIFIKSTIRRVFQN